MPLAGKMPALRKIAFFNTLLNPLIRAQESLAALAGLLRVFRLLTATDGQKLKISIRSSFLFMVFRGYLRPEKISDAWNSMVLKSEGEIDLAS